MKTFAVLDVRVSAVNLDTACGFLRDRVASGKQGYVCVAPVSTIVEARRDPAYRGVVNSAAMVTPDGMPVVWLGRQQGFKSVQRTYGPDLMLKTLDEGRKDHIRHFFYGASPEVCDTLEHRLREQFPGLIVAGKIAPPYTAQAEVLPPDVIEAINHARPDILWVGLGSPKQDFWMSLNRAALDVPVMVGVGAAFDFIAGMKPQAPRWMRASGLEWLFRLSCEPGRLWKRYFIGNTQFVYWILKESLFRK